MNQPRGDDQVAEVVREFLVASRALVGLAARSMADIGDVTLVQFRALVVISSQHGTPVSELAAALGVHPTTATRLTDRLVRKRLVRRSELADDRRVTQLWLTAGGERLVHRVTSRRQRDLAAIVRRMPSGTRTSLVEALRAFATAAGEHHDVDLFAWEIPVE